MQRIIVTGGSGKLGRATVTDLLATGYEVINMDLTPSKTHPDVPFIKVDFEDIRATTEAFVGMDWGHNRVVHGVVHLAAIPVPWGGLGADVFRTNVVTAYNVFETCRRLGIKNIVWASSETLLGIPYDTKPPYFPVDEDYAARPETAYSLSKHMGEQMAAQFCRWDADLKITGLRFSNVMEPWEYKGFPDFESDPGSRRFNLWSYIDARDGAQAIRLALEHEAKGFDTFVIANADGVMTRPNAALVAEWYPGVPFKREVGPQETLLSIDKARRVLGYAPQHSWRDEV